MADKKISQLTGASTPLAGTEVLPIVQSGSTVKVSSDDLTVKNVRSNATSGILQIAGPAAAATRTMTVPDANFTVARTDAAQNFTGNNTFDTSTLAIDSTNDRVGVGLTNPSYRLHVQGVAGAVSGTARATVLIDDTTAYAANVGGAITLRGKYNAAGDYVAGGYVQAQKTNATDGNDSFDVVLGTRENGNSTAEALRLTDTKDVKVKSGNLFVEKGSIIVGSAATAGGLFRTDGFAKVFTAATADIFSIRLYTNGAAFVDVAVAGIIATVGGKRQIARYAIDQVNGGTATATNVSTHGDSLISTAVTDSGDYSTVTFKAAGDASNQAKYQINVAINGVSEDGSGAYDLVVYTRI